MSNSKIDFSPLTPFNPLDFPFTINQENKFENKHENITRIRNLLELIKFMKR